jgi:hypothetical protein
MPKSKIFPVLLSTVIIIGCAGPYRTYKHREAPYHTKGMYSLFKTVGKLVRKPYNNNELNKIPFIVNSTMPASEFVDTASIYNDKLVSYSARIEDANADLMRVIWDYRLQQFGQGAPQPLLFPYPQNEEHTQRHYYIKFIPVADFQKAKPAHVWDSTNLIPGIKFKDILYLSKGGLEPKGGFMDTNYPDLYNNNFSSLGIFMEFMLLNGSRVKCYVITSDLYDNTTPHYVRWKIKI